MSKERAALVFPALVRVWVRLNKPSLVRFEQFLKRMGWSDEDAVKILLAYALAVAKGSGLTPEQVRDELGAARAELATLRHRAFMADDTIRTLEMNITGFTAALDQFERSLPAMEEERAVLMSLTECLTAEAAGQGVEVTPDPPDPVTSHQSLLNFFRYQGNRPPTKK